MVISGNTSPLGTKWLIGKIKACSNLGENSKYENHNIKIILPTAFS